MNPDQSNTTQGIRISTAGDDLTGKRSRLVVCSNSGGKRVFKLPTANNAPAVFIVQDEGPLGDDISYERLNPDKQYRIPLVGTCNPGDLITLADVATAANRGAVRAVPATSGTYRIYGIAEEAGVDGQRVLITPHSQPDVVVA